MNRNFIIIISLITFIYCQLEDTTFIRLNELFDRIEILHGQSKYEENLSLLEKADAEFPDNEKILSWIGNTYLYIYQNSNNTNDLQSAEEFLLLADELENSADIHYGLACVYSQKSMVDRSLEQLKMAWELGYNDSNWLLEDLDLINVRNSSSFESFFKQYFSKNNVKSGEYYQNALNEYYADNYKGAVKLFKKVIKYGKKTKIQRKELIALSENYIAACYQNLEKYKKSTKHYLKSIEYYLDIEYNVGFLYSRLAYNYQMLDDSQNVIIYIEKSIASFIDIGDSLNTAKHYSFLGFEYRENLKDYKLAIENYFTAHELYLKLGLEEEQLETKKDLALTMKNLGEKYFYEADYINAKEYLENSYDLDPLYDDLESKAMLLFYLSLVNKNLGNIEKAILLANKSQKIAEENDIVAIKVAAPLVIGLPLVMIGKVEEGIEIMKNSLEFIKNYTPTEPDETLPLALYTVNACIAYGYIIGTQNIEPAMPYMNSAFSIAESENLEDTFYYYLKSLFETYRGLDYSLMKEYLEKAIKHPTIKTTYLPLYPQIMNHFGLAHYYLKEYDSAYEKTIKAYEYSKNLNDYSGVGTSLQYIIIYSMIDAFYNEKIEKLKRTESALLELTTLIDNIYSYEQKYLKEIFERTLLWYEWYAMILIWNEKPFQALEILEEIKSKTLKQKLIATNNEIFDDIENEYILDVDLKDDQVLIGFDIINRKNNPLLVNDDKLLVESMNSAGIDISINDIDTGFDILVVSSYTSDSMFYFIPEQDSIFFNENMQPLEVMVKMYKKYLEQKDSRALELARKLYKYLFNLDPSIDRTTNKKHLIIMPDPILSYLPFETLIDENGKYLIETYDISYIQSKDIYAILQNRNYEKKANDILAFGGIKYNDYSDNSNIDPDINMNELEQIVEEKIQTRGSLANIYKYFGKNEFPELPATLSEVLSLKKQFPGADIKTGKEASENLIKEMSENGELSDYNILHFATHGLVMPEIPDLSSIILSSEEINEDGFLNSIEIMNLDIEADFVNLSACETGLGKLYMGEGVVGLTQSFLIAGANAVSVTLWPVADESTSIFMTEIYNTVQELNINYLESMSIVKRKFINGDFGEKYQDPYYWAPFVFYGN